VDGGWCLRSVSAVSRISRSPDRNQHVAPPLPGQLRHRLRDGLLHGLVPLAGVLALHGRAVADLHRVGAPRDLDHRGRVSGPIREVPGEAPRVDGSGGDDDLEIRPTRQELSEITQQEVDVEAPLVGLVHDQGVVFQEQPVPLDLGQQDAVGHQLDAGLRAHPVVEADLVAHERPGLAPQLLGDPAGQAAGGDAPGLGVADAPGEAPPQPQADLGELGRLAGARLPAQDHHLVTPDELGHLGAPLAHRELRRILDGRHLGPAALHQGLGGADRLPEARESLVDRLALPRAPAQAPQS
jgi:hypothetical protein